MSASKKQIRSVVGDLFGLSGMRERLREKHTAQKKKANGRGRDVERQ
jgi:hypothetical protein